MKTRKTTDFYRMLEFMSSASADDFRDLDYPLLLQRFSVEEELSEKMMRRLFGMSGYDVTDRLKAGDYIGMSFLDGKYYGCIPNKHPQ